MSADAPAGDCICVEVIRAWPRRHASVSLQLRDGATVADALEACGLCLDDINAYAVFGERVAADTRLQDGDRLELLQPLQIDPKQARRKRALERNRGRE